jgi:aryl-alcohol dehydrogenase-like predicted oxidoreductase
MVTPVGLGLAALGRPGYITLDHATDLASDYRVEAMMARAHAIIDHAWTSGVRYFDTARSYGRAEEFLGSWLASHGFDGKDMPVIGSKWGYTYTAEWRVDAAQHEVKDHTLPLLQRQWQESQQHLDGWLKLYQIHSATLESGVLTRYDVLVELARLKSHGVAIGLSLSGVNQAEVLEVALGVTVDGVRLFDTVQATWNLLEPSCGPMLQVAHDTGLGIIVKEAVANGRLTARNSAPTFAKSRALLDAIAARYTTTIDAIALAAALALPWASTVLSGAATPEQLSANLAALHLALSAEDLAILQSLAEPPQTYWATRSKLEWN